MQVKWGNGELNVTFEIGAPSVGSAMIAALAMDHLRRNVTTNGSFAILAVFVDVIRHTIKADGLPFELLKWNSTSEDIDRVFEAWCGVPEELGDVWTDAVRQAAGKGGASQSGDDGPLSQTGQTNNSTTSAKPPKRQRKSRGTTTGLTTPSPSISGG